MALKLYFLANDSASDTNQDLWVTDGTATDPVGNFADQNVGDVATGGLGPESITAFGQEMIFQGADSLNTGSSNGLWLTDGTAGGTTEIGGVSPGPGKSPPFNTGNVNGLSPNGFVTFASGSKAIFFGTDAADFEGLWVTDGTAGGTTELGGLENGQIAGKGTNLSPENLAAFNNSVLFDGFDSSGGGASYDGLWITDGTTNGTVEIGGSQNQGIFDSGTSNFIANDFINLGGMELFNAPNKEGDAALWITDGTANGTVEIGGVNNAGIVGADKDTNLGDGLANAVRFGDRIFFSGSDNDSAAGLWTTDGTASGTVEVGGLADAGVTGHPSSIGLNPTDLTVNGQQVLFNGQDAIGFQELWASDGTANGTYEIGGQGVGGALLNEASNGVNPTSIVSLGNGEAVFIGDDDSNGQASGKPTLWVTNGTFAGTEEIGGLDNLGVSNIDPNGGFSFTSSLMGGDGLAYFVGADAAGNQVLWETDGTLGGTKVITSSASSNTTDGGTISPSNMTLAAPPASATNISGGGQMITLENVPGEEVNLSSTNSGTGSDPDTVTGSNGTVNLNAAQASLIGGGLLVTFLGGAGNGNAVTLSNTNGNKDSIYGSKGVVTLNDAQANVFGSGGDVIEFGPGTGNVVYIYDTQGNPATVDNDGGTGTIYLNNAQAKVNGGGDTIYFSGTSDTVSIASTSGNWALINGSNGTINVASSQTSVIGGGDTINFSGTNDNASLYSTTGNWDTVNGANGTIIENGVQASVIGGGDTIDFNSSGNVVSLYSTAGNWDTVNGAKGTIIENGVQASVIGGGDTIDFNGSGNVVSLYSTSGNWDLVNGANGTIIENGAQASVIGGADTIDFNGSGNIVSLYSTSGKWDTVNGSNGTIIETSVQASMIGGGDTIDFNNSGDVVSLYSTSGNWDLVNGSDGTIIVNSAQASVIGGGDTIDFNGSGDAASLYSTASNWDLVNGSNGTIIVNSAQASVIGGGDTIDFNGSGDATSLYSTAGSWDTVNGSNGTIIVNSAQTSVIGGGDTIDFNGSGDAASLYTNGGAADVVNSSSAAIILTNSMASINGTGDTISFAGSDTATASGNGDLFAFGASLGHTTIAGFNASDSMQLSKTDFASFQALQQHMSQSGANALITLDASDQITLTNVTVSNLSASQFHFA